MPGNFNSCSTRPSAEPWQIARPRRLQRLPRRKPGWIILTTVLPTATRTATPRLFPRRQPHLRCVDHDKIRNISKRGQPYRTRFDDERHPGSDDSGTAIVRRILSVLEIAELQQHGSAASPTEPRPGRRTSMSIGANLLGHTSCLPGSARRISMIASSSSSAMSGRPLIVCIPSPWRA